MPDSQKINPIFECNIKRDQLTYADWQEIARGADQSNAWAYFRWVECSSHILSTLTIEDWEQIRDDCEFKDGWAYWQYKKYRG